MPMNPKLLRPRATGYVAKDADARAYISSVQTADGSKLEPAVAKAIDDFVAGCKTDGIWSAIKASCILMGARTLSGALTPLVGSAPTNNGPFVSGDYNRKTGLVGNGSTKYLNSNRNANADPQNSVHLAVLFGQTSTIDGIAIGAGFNLTGATRFGPLPVSSGATVRVRSSSVQAMSPLPSVPTVGTVFAVARSSSSLTTLRSAGAESTNASVSQTPYNGNYFVFGDNNAGSVTAFIDGRIAFYSIGESLTLSSLDTRVSTLYTAIGAAIP